MHTFRRRKAAGTPPQFSAAAAVSAAFYTGCRRHGAGTPMQFFAAASPLPPPRFTHILLGKRWRWNSAAEAAAASENFGGVPVAFRRRKMVYNDEVQRRHV